MFEKNIELVPAKKTSTWRKVALATWNTSEEASFYGWVDFDATEVIEVMEAFKARGEKISVTTIAAKAIAKAIAAYPQVNGMIRWGKISHRKNIDIFLQVTPDDTGDNLSGIVVRECDRKSLTEINKEIKEKAGAIKSGKDDGFDDIKGFLNVMPTIIIKLMLKILGFLNYTLNTWSPLYGAPKDGFGSAMITSVGMLGIQRGFAPLIPNIPCPIIITIGKIEQKPIVKDGQVVVGEVLPMCATMDHRLIDGVGASIMFRALKEYFKNPH